MDYKEKNRIMEELSDLTIAGLKKLAEDGQKLTREALIKVMKDMPEVHSLIDNKMGGKKEIKQNDGELERLKGQKEKLIRQLDELEDKNLESEKVYKRIMIFLAEWLKTEKEGGIDDQIKQFKEVLKKRANLELLEEVFGRLKTQVMNAELALGDKGEPKKKSFLSRLMSKETPAEQEQRYILQFRAAYQDIINELGLDLGAGFLEKLLLLGKRINSSVTFDDFAELRKDILDLLHEYVGTVSRDREKTAEFIKDIGKKLMEVENDLIKTFGITDDVLTSNERFDRTLMEELNDLETSVGFSQKMDELKEVVSAKLVLIKTTVRKKRESDLTVKESLDMDMVRLKSEFEKLKTEADAAREKAERFEQEIFTDPLTNAMNRRAYDKRIKEEFDRYLRYQRTFSTLLFDVDRFKSINDGYGHATGDICLKEIIKRVAPLLRESDMLARYGGEEFIVILPETDKKGAGEVAEKLRKTVENIEFVHRDSEFRVTISIGVTESLVSDNSPAELFNRMDMAMYEAKNSGRNKVVFK